MIAYRPIDPKGKRGGNIPKAVVSTAGKRHPDGYGVAWRDTEGLHIERTLDHNAFTERLRAIDKSGVEYVAHWRFATSGPKDVAHAHPYTYTDPIEGLVAVFHNGIIDIQTTPEQSDTEVFVNAVLAQLPSRWWTNNALKYLVHEAIGWSKLVVMTATETVSLQDSRGEWDGGIWYSSDHKPATSGATYTWKGSSKWTKTNRLETDPAVIAARRWADYEDDDDDFYNRTRPNGKGTQSVPLLTPGAVTVVTPRDVDKPRTLKHNGHFVSAVADVDWDMGDRDYEAGVICDTCKTMGDLFIIDGAAYVEMAHLTGAVEDGIDSFQEAVPF